MPGAGRREGPGKVRGDSAWPASLRVTVRFLRCRPQDARSAACRPAKSATGERFTIQSSRIPILPFLGETPQRNWPSFASENSSRCADGQTQATPGPLPLPRLRPPAQGPRHLRRPPGGSHHPPAPPKKTHCGVCGQACRTYYDKRPRPVRDLSCGDKRVYLDFQARRVHCSRCGGVKREQLDWLADNPLYTKRFASFYAWRRTLRERDRSAEQTPPSLTFLPIHVRDDGRPVSPPLELVFANGRCLRIPIGFDPEQLRAVLRAVEELSC